MCAFWFGPASTSTAPHESVSASSATTQTRFLTPPFWTKKIPPGAVALSSTTPTGPFALARA
jgi:hypothetical protein